ncbi:MAG: TolC family protein [Treponema sp.]|jgi:outer membrane protein TolC|nr:TolC family protein [Treponema sp.]
MKTKPALLCLGVLIVLRANHVFAETALDIEAAVGIALEKNLSLERSRMESASAKRRYGRSWNSLIPSLEAGVLAARPTSITGPVPPESNTWMPGFSLSAGLQLSPSLVTDIKRTKEDYEAGLLNYAAARQDLEFQVRRLYYQLLVLRANTELMEQNAAGAQGRYEQIRARQRAGQASNLEELSARLDVQTRRTDAQSAAAAYENALDSLKHLLMIPPEETIVLRGALQTLSFAEAEISAETSGEAPAIGALRKTISSLEAQRRGLRISSYAPSLNLSWNASPLYSGKTHDWTDSGLFSITLSIKPDNFLPWSRAKEEIDSLSDSIAMGQNQLRESILGRQNAIQKLRRDIAQSGEAVETLRLNVTLAGESYRAYEDAYRRGAVDIQSLYSARDNVLLAENQLLSEQYNLAAAILELEKELALPFGTLMRWE